MGAAHSSSDSAVTRLLITFDVGRFFISLPGQLECSIEEDESFTILSPCCSGELRPLSAGSRAKHTCYECGNPTPYGATFPTYGLFRDGTMLLPALELVMDPLEAVVAARELQKFFEDFLYEVDQQLWSGDTSPTEEDFHAFIERYKPAH